jgi:small subunit ribosomal protein S2
MFDISMKTMLESGVHFGHQTSRWNPKMAKYIFGERNGIHILDLQKTVKELKKVYSFIKDKSQEGSTFLFVGTKKQAQDIIRQEAEKAQVACVYEKWLGGTLTNFATIRKSVERLEEIELLEKSGVFKRMSKKEVSRLTKEMNRLRKLLNGFRMMRALPDIVFIIDPVEDYGAVNEARKLGIPIVAVCDTNSNPDLIDYPIPGNDDAARSIKLFCEMAADAVMEGRKAAQEAKAGTKVMKQEVEETPEAEEQVPVEESPVEDANPEQKASSDNTPEVSEPNLENQSQQQNVA